MTINLTSIRKKYFRIFCWRGSLKNYIARGGFDVTFLALVIILLTFGLVMMFSASYVNAWYNAGSVNTKGDPYFYFENQLVFVLVGLAIMFIVSRIRVDVFEDASFLALIVAIILLVYVLINPKVIPEKEDFRRWMAVPIIGTFQPSEFAKIALAMYCAWSLNRRKNLIENEWWTIIPYLAVIAIVCGLVYAENHLSGTILIFCIGIVMTFLGGAKLWIYFAGAAAVGALAVVLIASGKLDAYAHDRIEIWLKLLTNQELTASEKVGDGWQILQSLYAIGSGGAFGLGFGQSKQKHLYIPEPQNDFIFPIICEELGYVRALIIMALFILLVARGFVLALRSKSRFGALLAMGICFQIGLEAGLNIAVVTGTVPNTGISLPFFSYGGSAMVTLMAEMGIVLSVSRGTTKSMKGSSSGYDEA